MGNLSSFGGSSGFGQLLGMGGPTGQNRPQANNMYPPSLGQPQVNNMMPNMQGSGGPGGPISSAVGPNMTPPTQLGGSISPGTNQSFGSK